MARYKMPQDEIELIETLRSAQYQANALDGHEHEQDGGTYGAIKAAMLTALRNAFAKRMSEENAAIAAVIVYESMIDNGEDAAYNIGKWQEGDLDTDYVWVRSILAS